MKKNYYLILCIYFFSCAVQGPISGGPIDESPPNLLYTTPENFSTSISNKEKIILYFDELLDPISVYKSIVINNQDFKIRTKGEKVIISPSNEWDKNFLIDIYINKYLSDYQQNNLRAPINLFYTQEKEISRSSINGKILDIRDIINKHDETDNNISFEVGLFKHSLLGAELIKKVQSNENLEFAFNAVSSGEYLIGVVEDKIIDMNLDFYQRRYSILNNITILSNNDSLNVSLNISNPISKKEISSIDFINQYYVNYIFNDGSIELGIIDTIYNNFNQINFSGQLMEIALSLSNDFGNYNTNTFEFIIPEILDTIPPFINSISSNDFNIKLHFSEPIQDFNDLKPFYIVSDSSKIYLDFQFENSELRNIVNISGNKIYDMPYTINIQNNIISDMYGNTLADSVALINLDDQLHLDSKIGTGNIFGKILNGNLSKSMTVVLYNIKTLEKILVLADKNHNFSFKLIQPGEYFLQCYENYNSDKEFAYPYFSGEWGVDINHLQFSNFIGPFEVRANWDIEDIVIDLK